MTKISVIKLFVPFLCGLVLAGLTAEAARNPWTEVSDIGWRGHIGVEGLLYLKPSGVAGTSQFQIPHAGVELSTEFANGVTGDIEVSFQSPVTTGNEFNIERASLTSDWGPDCAYRFRAGLFEPAWLQGAEEFWSFDRYSKDLKWAFERWGYTSAADYGFEVFSRGPSGGFGLAVVNGEGIRRSEQGPQKDFHLWAAWDLRSETRRTEFLVTIIRGGYENIPTAAAAKERYSLAIRTAAEVGVFAGLEALQTRDPVDAINLKVAQDVDLTDLGGQRVSGQMGSMVLGYRFEPRDEKQWQAFARRDVVQPVAGEAERAVTSTQLGLVYSPAEGVNWLIHSSSLEFGKKHSNTTRDENTWRVSYHVGWN